jgi:hypothetical protein
MYKLERQNLCFHKLTFPERILGFKLCAMKIPDWSPEAYEYILITIVPNAVRLQGKPVLLTWSYAF